MELTHEKKIAICEEYKDRRNTVNQIADKYGISRGEVAHIAVELGAEPRYKNRYDVKYTIEKHSKKIQYMRTCPKCRKTIDVKGARFCYFCGADIRSGKELLIERIEKAAPLIQLLPVSTRDELQKLFLDIETELRK